MEISEVFAAGEMLREYWIITPRNFKKRCGSFQTYVIFPRIIIAGFKLHFLRSTIREPGHKHYIQSVSALVNTHMVWYFSHPSITSQDTTSIRPHTPSSISFPVHEPSCQSTPYIQYREINHRKKLIRICDSSRPQCVCVTSC